MKMILGGISMPRPPPADDMPEPSTDARGLYDQRIQTAQAELAAAKPIDKRDIGFLPLPHSMDYGDDA